ncbi:olfactory receptor 11A1-like [Ascaphus truei]|uniref:olfactory receptor 11A1-like n=1 Tax=Ascaphus truei TaxID=8439 RepID=UPI003F59D247
MSEATLRKYKDNRTVVTEFLLLGFENLQDLKILLFLVFLTIYILSLAGNLLIIVLVSASHCLHSPMYFFLRNLSMCEILFTTTTVPNMLHVIWAGKSFISVSGCIAQLYFYGSSGIAECFLLTVMSYDRYLAICHPLHYASTMDFSLFLRLVAYSWLGGFLLTLIVVSLIITLQFCDRYVIDNFFCDLAPILQLSCSDTSPVEIVVFVVCIPCFFFPLVIIVVSYIYIFITVLRIPSTAGRQKTFSNCSSHLAVVCTFYGTLIALYVKPPGEHSFKANKFLSLLYSVVTPLFNPIIYSLRNKVIQKALWTLMYSKLQKGKM